MGNIKTKFMNEGIHEDEKRRNILKKITFYLRFFSVYMKGKEAALWSSSSLDILVTC